jgi:hypothetical protein
VQAVNHTSCFTVLSGLSAIRKESNFGESTMPLTDQGWSIFSIRQLAIQFRQSPFSSSKAGDARLRASAIRAFFDVER